MTFSISNEMPSPDTKHTGESTSLVDNTTSFTSSFKASFMASSKSLFVSFCSFIFAFSSSVDKSSSVAWLTDLNSCS